MDYCFDKKKKKEINLVLEICCTEKQFSGAVITLSSILKVDFIFL